MYYSSTVIRQKREPQKGCSKKTKHVKFSEKTNMSYPQGVRNVLFFGEFGGVLCFLETPVLRLALLLYYRRVFTENFLLLSRKISSFYGNVPPYSLKTCYKFDTIRIISLTIFEISSTTTHRNTLKTAIIEVFQVFLLQIP